jgi:hypothetical protein
MYDTQAVFSTAIGTPVGLVASPAVNTERMLISQLREVTIWLIYREEIL